MDRLSREVIYEAIEHYSEDPLKLHHFFEEIPLKMLEPLEKRQQKLIELTTRELKEYLED